MKIINQYQYLNYNIIKYDVLDSTMSLARHSQPNTIIVADMQTNGKGKMGRVWKSEKGNLYFSINIQANDKNVDYSQFTFITSIAVRYAISNIDNNNCNIVSKWPNDVLINNKKVSGILLEFDFLEEQLIIGCGINISSYPVDTIFPATSLNHENICVDKDILLKKVLDNFNLLMEEWKYNNFSVIRKKWLDNCYKLKEEIKVDDEYGIFEDIDENGNLILKQKNNQVKIIKTGDVF